MAQIYYHDSMMMVHQGETVDDYEENWPDYDSATQTITASAQVFQENWDRFAWFYMPSIGEYFKTTDKRHAYFEAAKALFSASRWEEIEDGLDEVGPLNQYFASMDLPKIKRKVQRARDLGIITTAELQALSGLLP